MKPAVNARPATSTPLAFTDWVLKSLTASGDYAAIFFAFSCLSNDYFTTGHFCLRSAPIIALFRLR
jgi:hypothetical protein